MENKIILSCALALCTLNAHAQSSVTLYGVIDNGLFYSTNQGGKHAVQFLSSPTETSVWGLRGSEDLGGGNKVIFKLGSAFSMANGTAWPSGRIFGDYAWIGLSSTSAGTLKLGRMLDSVGDYLGDFAATGSWGGALYAHPYDNDNLWATYMVNNAVKYQSIELAGVTFGGMYAFSNKAGAASGSGSGFADNRLWAAGLAYEIGRLKLAAVYEQLDHPGDDAPGSLGAVDVLDANFTAARQRIFGLGAHYAFDRFEIGSNVTRTVLEMPTGEWQNPAFTGASGLSFNNYELNATFHATAAVDVKGAYTYTTASVDGKHPHWNQFGLLAEYALSKRTQVYLDAVYQRVHGDDTPFSQAQINTLSPASGNTQALVGLGIRHRF
ncbi:porin [Burkholderia lata]|uniref:Outer membrane protein, (Porin) n=1 Tax=Burkholderia lata (strain ATCC 17760 / DSM 23089 / LMG 22485 / NCIMB 9086 / R18194 / 383) TaxID=482957 RepID=Q39HT5_BURL3|nr:porin [Burkholderia lata]ABB07981.1 outer membrane protein, (porin) [Burkholderia lata]